MIRGYSYRDSPSYGDEEHRWDPHFVSLNNPRNGAQGGYRPFEERHAIRPFGLPSSFPSDFYPATRIIIVSNNTGQGLINRPRLLATPSHGVIPRFNGPETSETMESTSETNPSKLTKQEQSNVLKKLKKEIYNPMPKTLARRVSLYYRDLNKINPNNTNNNAAKNHDVEDQEMKSCVVCLEDFEANEQVMITPCNHMFHQQCIVPWVKNHGHCPVCRASFCDNNSNSSSNNSSSNNNNNNNNNRRVVDHVGGGGQHVRFHDEFLSLIQAMDEAFPRRM